jgi:adenosylcobinamide-GDP ribazoletransferase
MSAEPRQVGNAMWHELRLFATALQCLTRLRLPAWVGWDAAWPPQSVRHFPGAGLVVGAMALVSMWAAAHAWPALVTVLVGMAATVWLTRAQHESALADAVGQRYGTVALTLVLALKAAALHGLVTRDFAMALAALPLAHAWSRAAIVWGLHLAPQQPQRQSSPGADTGASAAASGVQPARADAMAFVLANLWCVWAAAAASLFVPLRALAVAALVSLLLAWWLARAPWVRDTQDAPWVRNTQDAPWVRNTQDAPAVRDISARSWGGTQQLAELAVYLALLGVLAQG